MIRIMNPACARVLDVLDEFEELNAGLRRIAAPVIAVTASTIAIGEIVARAALPAQIITEITHA